jgi:hypothetical protein
MQKTYLPDVITYLLFSVAIALCTWSTVVSRGNPTAMGVSIAAGVGFLAIASALIGTRIWFRATYKFWLASPTRMGFRGDPCWDKDKARMWSEAVVEFWSDRIPIRGGPLRFQRSAVAKALEGVTVVFKPEPWSYMKRLVAGLASSEAVWVAYDDDPMNMAFGHELSHVILGNLTDMWDEEMSHKAFKTHGFSNLALLDITCKRGAKW